MSFELATFICLALIVIILVADLAHALFCDRRSERAFRKVMRQFRTLGETAAGEVP